MPHRGELKLFFHCVWILGTVAFLPLMYATAKADDADLRVGFAAVEVTPEVNGPRPVWLAGQEPNRRATEVRDPLFARAIVLRHADQRIALVAVDSIGIQHPLVRRVRKRLPSISYCLVASTHTHEGPDCVGIWGPDPATSGVDPKYLELLEDGIVAAVEQASQHLASATAEYGTAADPSLLKDYRLPVVLDPVLRVLRFRRSDNGEVCGMLVQWNSHPVEPDGNHAITRDWIGMTVDQLEQQHGCPVVYFSGAVGGLMGTPDDRFTDKQGNQLAKDAFDFMEMYADAVAELANRAMATTSPIDLTPLYVSATPVALPLDNPGFRAARAANVLKRPTYRWTGNATRIGDELPTDDVETEQALRSEVAYLRFGELHVAAIPGELYPEMVYGKFPTSAEPEADYPAAPPEPCIEETLPGKKMLVLGLANDAIGYLIPKRQWDVEPPYAYGTDAPQYGETSSLGPRTGALVMEALVDRVQAASPDIQRD